MDSKYPEKYAQLINALIPVLQKTRSNLQETVDVTLLNLLHPELFPSTGRIGVLEMALAISKKEIIETVDVYNLLFLVNRIEPVVFMWDFWWPEQKLPQGMQVYSDLYWGKFSLNSELNKEG